MSILNLDLDAMRRCADFIGVKSDFARNIERACDVLATMETQQQAFDELLSESRKMIRESRALLQKLDQELGREFGAGIAL